jgi:hypothetical protein
MRAGDVAGHCTAECKAKPPIHTDRGSNPCYQLTAPGRRHHQLWTTRTCTRESEHQLINCEIARARKALMGGAPNLLKTVTALRAPDEDVDYGTASGGVCDRCASDGCHG